MVLASALRRKSQAEPAKPTKDIWDKIAALTVPFVTLVLGLLGAFATASHNATVLEQQDRQAKAQLAQQIQQALADQQLRTDQAKDARLISGLQQMKDLYPYISSNDAAKRTFGYEMYAALGYKKIALELISVRQDTAGVSVLKQLVKDTDPSIRSAAKSSLTGLDVVTKFETFTPTTIKSTANDRGVVGYGHAITDAERAAGRIVVGDESVSLSENMSETFALKLLRADMAPAYAAVDDLVKVPISNNQRDALASFVFNMGKGNFRASNVLKKLNQRDYDGAKLELGKWVNGAGRVIPGLAKRRAAEIALWDRPDAVKPTP